jgi:2-dehydropantoate 2-reductase
METTAEIKKFVWKKSIFNSCTMPISALTGMDMKEVMDFPPTRRLVELLLNESISIAASLGYDYGPGFFEKALDFNTRAEAHRPSMLVDLENGRKTENPFLIRRIAEYADQQGVPAPLHRTMANLIEAIEMRQRSGAKDLKV